MAGEEIAIEAGLRSSNPLDVMPDEIPFDMPLQRRISHEQHHDQRWNPDLLQGLGQRTACSFQPWLAPQRGRWEDQMIFLASPNYRCIAHDRRGHGRCSQPWNGNDMDTYAADLAVLVQTLDRNAYLEHTLVEMNHRIKNHFQMLAALLDIQVDAQTQTLSAECVTRMRAHLQALAALHDLLTQSARERTNEDRLSARAILDQMIATMQMLAVGKRIHYHAEEVTVSARQAVVLAMITHELVNNALKYGSENIKVTLTSREEIAVLKVCDDGPGFPALHVTRHNSGVGRELVQRMSHQDMRGSVRYENLPYKGTTAVVEFPLNVDTESLDLHGQID
jgi:two-component sensor histidine kinase